MKPTRIKTPAVILFLTFVIFQPGTMSARPFIPSGWIWDHSINTPKDTSYTYNEADGVIEIVEYRRDEVVTIQCEPSVVLQKPKDWTDQDFDSREIELIGFDCEKFVRSLSLKIGETVGFLQNGKVKWDRIKAFRYDLDSDANGSDYLPGLILENSFLPAGPDKTVFIRNKIPAPKDLKGMPFKKCKPTIQAKTSAELRHLFSNPPMKGLVLYWLREVNYDKYKKIKENSDYSVYANLIRSETDKLVWSVSNDGRFYYSPTAYPGGFLIDTKTCTVAAAVLNEAFFYKDQPYFRLGRCYNGCNCTNGLVDWESEKDRWKEN